MHRTHGALRALGISLNPDHLISSRLLELDECAKSSLSHDLVEALLENYFDQEKSSVADYIVAIVARLHCALISSSSDAFVAHIGAIVTLVRDCETRFCGAQSATFEEADAFAVLKSLSQVLQCIIMTISQSGPMSLFQSLKIREAYFSLWLLGNMANQCGWSVPVADRCIKTIENCFLDPEHAQVKQIQWFFKSLANGVRVKHACCTLWSKPLDEDALGILAEFRSKPLQIPQKLQAHLKPFKSFRTVGAFDRYRMAFDAFSERSTLFADSQVENWTHLVRQYFANLANNDISAEEKGEYQTTLAEHLRKLSFRDFVYRARFSPPRRVACQFLAILFKRNGVKPQCSALRSSPYVSPFLADDGATNEAPNQSK